MKYVVSGYIGFDNFGDEAIAHVLAEKLKNEGAEKITFISSNPAKTTMLHQVNSCGMLNFFKPLQRADVLISGGGSLLQDVTSIKSLIYYLGVIYTALVLGKKVEIYAQGIGPINSVTGRILTKFALKHAYKISVRDRESQKFLENWGIKSDLVADPILNIDIPDIKKDKVVCVQLRDFEGVTKDFLDGLAQEVTKRFPQKEIRVLSLQDSCDMQVCERFVQILREHQAENVKMLGGLGLTEAIKELSSAEYLIAMRFHANIIGIKSGAKTLAIDYDPKVEKLAAEYNLPVISLKSWNLDLASAFDKLCTND